MNVSILDTTETVLTFTHNIHILLFINVSTYISISHNVT